MKRMCFVFAMLFFTGVNAQAQEMRPLDDLLQTSAKSYPFVRCGGLYQAMMGRAGVKRLGKEWFAAMDMARKNFILTAALIQKNVGVDGELIDITKITVRDAGHVADLYIKRFDRNYAAVGEALGQDKMINSDLALCKSIVDALNAKSD